MQNIIVEKPYQFIPPIHGRFWPTCFVKIRLHDYLLRTREGVVEHEVRHIERLRASLAAGHSILVTPNHCRTADPLAMGYLSAEARCNFYILTSWHLFQPSGFVRWIIRAAGGFSINREGVDRQAINTAIDLVAEAKRPLVVFPEGATSRTADCLQPMLDGVAFIGRAAAKRLAKSESKRKVVVHPVAVRYFFGGDIRAAADQVLTDIEQRLTWTPHRQLPLLDRIFKVGSALLSLKEIEHFGQAKCGTLGERLVALMDRLLGPIEQEWLGKAQSGSVVARVRNLRVKIVPDLVAGTVTPEERNRRWKQLGDIYLAQQLSTYPPDYLAHPTVERILEILEKFEEDITDKARLHGRLKVVLDVGEPIEVSRERQRGADVDPLMAEIQKSLQGMLDNLATESRRFE